MPTQNPGVKKTELGLPKPDYWATCVGPIKPDYASNYSSN